MLEGYSAMEKKEEQKRGPESMKMDQQFSL